MTRPAPAASAASSTCQVPSTLTAMMSSGLPAVSWASAARCTMAAQPVRRPPDRGEVEQIIAVGAVEAGDLMAEARQMLGRDRGTT